MSGDHISEWIAEHTGHNVHREEWGPAQNVGPHFGVSSKGKGSDNDRVQIVLVCGDCSEHVVLDAIDDPNF